MRALASLGLHNSPRHAGVTAALLLTLLFCAALVGVVLPQLPAEARPPLSSIVQLLVFSSAAVILFLLRGRDATAALAALALALSGMADAGPARGVAWDVPFGSFVTGLSWIAFPVAVPVIALAILYFPARSALLERRPWVHAVPWLAAAPMLVIATARALHLWGIQALASLAAWSDAHPIVYYGSFSAALTLNLLAIVEGLHRYRFNQDANERRRIRMVVYTVVPGVLAYAIKDGLPIALALAGQAQPDLPAGVRLVLHALVLLPAFGLVYAVAQKDPAAAARRRRRVDPATGDMTGGVASRPMMECPACGRCEDFGAERCAADGSVMHPVPAVPRLIDQKYRIEQLLGRGGTGAVYRARDVRHDRLVALKIVRAGLLADPGARQRFHREAQIVAALQHPSIVPIVDYGTFVDGGAYLVMEMVRGEDLRRVLQREGRLDVDRALPILAAVCAAIACAHREGVLHRDLKPENILLPGGGGEAVVLDFGVAGVVREGAGEQDTRAPNPSPVITTAGMIVGTPAYMAPEQLRGTAPDPRSDVFSLGVVAFEMLTGELPFGRGSIADVVLAQARGIPAFPPGLGLPSDVEHAVRSALRFEPADRPPSVEAFARLLGT